MHYYFDKKFRVLLVVFVAFMGAIAPTFAQAPIPKVQILGPYPAEWRTGVNSNPVAATPEEACKIQHKHFNPLAPYSPATYVRENYWNCNWKPSQEPGGGGNTVYPSYAAGQCPRNDPYFSYTLREGKCVPTAVDTKNCDCDPAQTVNAPLTPLIGDPVNVTSGALVEHVTDYESADGLLKVSRRYTSNYQGIDQRITGFGQVWKGPVPTRLLLGANLAGANYYSGNGEAGYSFSLSTTGGIWTFGNALKGRIKLSLVAQPSVTPAEFMAAVPALNGPADFRLEFGNGDYTLYRRSSAPAAGAERYAVPVERGTANGYVQYFDYLDDDNFPDRIRDSFGRHLTLTWQNVEFRGVSGVSPGAYKVISAIGLLDAQLHL
jgi:hypothetical protein